MPGLADIISVQHVELDRQHELCARALGQLRSIRNVSSLREVLRCYKMHFQYEESLLDAHLYKDLIVGGKQVETKGFSAALDARKSHYRDHKRLIGEIEEMVSCADDDDERLPAKFVSEVLRNFERHANVYDDGYADALHAALH